MGLLRSQVDALAGSDRRRYCREILQIGFNAWHYADSNLWASLADEIFRQLGGSDERSGEHAERIRTELSGRLEQRSQLEAATEQARAAAAELQARVDSAAARRESEARSLLRALNASPAVRRKVDKLWARLGVTSGVEQGKLLAEATAAGR